MQFANDSFYYTEAMLPIWLLTTVACFHLDHPAQAQHQGHGRKAIFSEGKVLSTSSCRVAAYDGAY
jgi:hypothetical protein